MACVFFQQPPTRIRGAMIVQNPRQRCHRVDGPHAISALMYPSDHRAGLGISPPNLAGLSLVDEARPPKVEAYWVRDLARELKPGTALELVMLVPSARYLRAIHRPSRLPFTLVSATRSFGDAPPRALDDLVIAVAGRRLAETACFFLIRPPTPQHQAGEEALSFARFSGGRWIMIADGEILDVRSSEGAKPCLWGRDREGRLRILAHEFAHDGQFGIRFWDGVDEQSGIRSIPARFDSAHCPFTVDAGVVHVDVRGICTGAVKSVGAEELPCGTRVVGKLETAPHQEGEAWVVEHQNGAATLRQAVALMPLEHGLPSFRLAAEALATGSTPA